MSGETPLPTPSARYLQVARALSDGIAAGRYPLGELLPSEPELCRRFGVSRHTVREALLRLRDAGLIASRRGVGTRVVARQAEPRYVFSAAAVADLSQYARETRLTIDGRDEVTADGALAELLECAPGRRWLRLCGRRYAGGARAPFAHATIYLDPVYEAAAHHIGASPAPVFRLIEEMCGVRVTLVEQEVSVVALGAAEAAALGAAPGGPGMRIARRYFDAERRLLEAAVNLHPADRFIYRFSMRLEWPGAPAASPK